MKTHLGLEIMTETRLGSGGGLQYLSLSHMDQMGSRVGLDLRINGIGSS
jgi:hypothetical protein